MGPRRQCLWDWASPSGSTFETTVFPDPERIFSGFWSILVPIGEAFRPELRKWDMATLTIKFNQGTTSGCCGLCGGQTPAPLGPRLFLADRPDVVCRKCGNKYAPSLVALLDLANVAERVGRIGRHTLVPPLGALLDLARAAEDYTHSTPDRRRKVA